MLARDVRTLAGAAPASRDRTVDLVRAGAVLVVVVGHWLAVVVVEQDGRLVGGNVLAVVGWTQPLTWLAQVMPLFFVVGGWATAASWRSARGRGEPAVLWLRHRLDRLLRPTTGFLVAGCAAVLAARAVGVETATVQHAGWLAVIALWFLAVYVVVVALVPLLVAAQDRWGLRPVVALAAASAGADLLRLGAGVPGVGLASFLTVWLCFAGVGVAWQAGRLRPASAAAAVLAAGGTAAAVLLVALGPYPLSMVNVPGTELHNTSPPTLALLALGLGQAGAVLLLAPRLARLAGRPAVWTAVVAVNLTAMSLFLWHLVPVVVVAPLLALVGLLPSAEPGSAAWLATRPLWVAVLAVVLAALVAAVARAERPRPLPAARPAPGGRLLSAAGVLAVAAGLVQLTVGGLVGDGPAGLPLLALACYAAGLLLLRVAVRQVLPVDLSPVR